MLKRIIILVAGISLMALGVALTVLSTLGTTPISALPAALSPITGLSVGTVTVITNSSYVLMQILLLRERYQWIQLFQLATGALFGVFIDVAMFIVAPLRTDAYLLQLPMALAGVVAMGLGIGVQVHANVINLPGEGLVLALTSALRRAFGERKHLHFGNVKIASDFTHVVLAVVLALVFLGMVVGVREATVISVFALGPISKWFLDKFPPYPAIDFSGFRRG
ncbi:YczE/YyaS/YitT family protein [Corynebacterium cystitidis]|uniref:YczE/YyaS/YitT family protein n=1 Tax=Corynebacterium cystitidis TaxID=35757 RepID=UPI00211EA9D2|nr:DUF6198 family protein [Corynebacterium cystitidis]